MKKRITFTLDEQTIEKLKIVSQETMIPQARLVEQAILKLIDNHKKDTR